jgi:hypothetical protein
MPETQPAPIGSLVTEYSLRCAACGAPYEGPPAGEILTCTYCGTSSRSVDARQFLDHFMAQVTSFIRQAVPPGLDLSRSQSVDPVARLAAFNSGIRPRLATESDQYRLSCFRLLSAPLAVLPFASSLGPPSSSDPTRASVFAAQVQSVAGLAVDDSSRELVRRAGGLASCYQSLLVATRLSNGSQPERFHLISQDCRAASEAIESTGRWPALVMRLRGLEQHCLAVDGLLTGREVGESRRLLASARDHLNQTRVSLATTPDLGYMTTAVDQELSAVRIVSSMLDLSENSPSVLPHPLAYLERLSGVLDWLSRYTPADWVSSFRSIRLREEVFRRAAELRAAQGGRGGVKVVIGGGGCFVPFWVIELPYTFETGVLWSKRGKEVAETVLVAATFPTDLPSLAAAGTSRVLTNVFGATTESRPLGDYYDRMRGKQQKISESGGLGQILQSRAVFSLPGQQAVPPFSTETEALRLVQLYVDSIRTANPRAAAQLRASSPRVIDLVYGPCTLQVSPLVPWLGALSPASLGDPQALAGFLS